MALPQTFEALASRYENNIVLRALVQLIPYNLGSAADTALLARLQNVRAERARVFFEELARGEVELRPELLENNDFLHCYFSTAEAVLRTHRSSKIQAFARLLRASANGDCIDGVDEYEEFLSIIDDLSHRELCVLSSLANYEARHEGSRTEGSLHHSMTFWREFTQDLEQTLKVRPDEIGAILTRLSRSGCYAPPIGGYWDGSGRGVITPLFYRLRNLVLHEYEM